MTQAGQAPENAIDALNALGIVYDDMAGTGAHNLNLIQSLLAMGRDLRDGAYAPFAVARVEPLLAYAHDGKRASVILGEISPQGSFYPSVTERILHIHNQINVWNGLLSMGQPITPPIVPMLQDIMIFTAHISRIASYLSIKLATAKKFPDASPGSDAALKAKNEKDFNAYVQSLPPYMARFFTSCIDRNHLSSILQKLRVGDYSTMEYDVSKEGRMINHYLLPMDLANPYLAHLARLQADTMATKTPASA